MKKSRKIINIVISFVIMLIIWKLICNASVNGKTTVPSPRDVINAIKEMNKYGYLIQYILVSLYRFIVGYGISVVCAVLLGLILGWYTKIWDIVDPIVQVLRPISPTAWFPFIVLFFGIGNIPAIVIIFISAFFPVLISTVNAVKKIDNIYLKVADNFGIKKLKFVRKIVLPAVFPNIANALHLALGSAWIFLVAGEMVGAQSGLGYLIIDSRNNLRYDMLLAGIIIIGIVGLILDKLIGKVEKLINAKFGNA